MAFGTKPTEGDKVILEDKKRKHTNMAVQVVKNQQRPRPTNRVRKVM